MAASKSKTRPVRIDMSEWESRSIRSLEHLANQETVVQQLSINWSFIAEINHLLRDQGKGPILDFYSRNGEYFLESYQFAAQICLGDLEINIEPRNLISPGWFPKMIQTMFKISFLPRNVGGNAAQNSILELYYIAFLRILETALNRGVYREYITCEDNLRYLKERLLVNEHIKRNRGIPNMIYSEFSELSADNLINQTLYYALDLLGRNRVLAKNPTRRRLVFQYFNDECNLRKVPVDQIKNIPFNRMNFGFQETIHYAMNIIRHTGGDFRRSGQLKLSAFYVDMNELFESFVGESIKRAYRDDHYLVMLQSRDALDDKKVFGIRPDILLKTSDEQVRIVADTKYKRLRESVYHNYGIEQSDIYQILAYAHRYHCSEAILIYPKPPNSVSLETVFRIEEVNVRIKEVNLQSDTESISASSVVDGIFSDCVFN